MPTYQLSSSDGRGYLFPIGGTPLTIGRNKDNVLVLNDEAASRYHCVLLLDEAGNPALRDLGSRNGTRHNNEKIFNQTVTINPGDSVKIGTHSFVIETEETIGEVRTKAKGRAAASEESGPASGWLGDISTVITNLPPKGEGLDAVTLIDAAGNASGALGGESEGPRAMRMMLLLAAKSRCTDLHLEPKQNVWSLRIRVDGQMVSVCDFPEKVGQLVLGLVKTACLMRMAADSAVQDGRFGCKLKDRRVDYRVSITPSVHGQKLVIRVLDSAIAPRSLTELGLPPYMYERVRKVSQKEQGFVLVCGPTGSGKTTTLYNALREIDRETTNVVTIEDPVEYQLDNTTQIPCDESKGNTFSNLLRSVLRQDPDVILVGEIRDEETARTAMQAAMTGHLVFSTVHSKDSISAVFRLLDLKVEPFLVASSLDLVLAQRLVRQLCDNCKAPVRIKPGESTRLGKYLEGKNEVYVPVGCAACLKTGYRGRKAIYEMLDFSDELRDIVLKEPNITSMKKVIEKGLFTTLQQSGWVLASRGMTDLEEVDRVAGGH
ncbi:MAG: ATPase, T2SS/T4P/T4SS family [Phycisphaerales bacterium]|jgi:general secretion pathway protein E|nr:Flp pilus assembly complex ATPase component TadA [Phycisphaeraceae bacterium]